MKLFSFSLITILFLGCSIASAQNTISRDITTFDKVRVQDNVTVTFKKSDHESLTFTAVGVNSNQVITEVDGRELKIKMKPGFHGEAQVNVEVTFKKIRSIELGNSSRVQFQDTITTNELELNVSGNATLKLNVNVEELKVIVATGARIDIAGRAGLQDVTVNTNAKYLAYELESKDGFVKVSTGAEGVFYATDNLDITAASRGEAKYRGSPKSVKSATNLGGKISGNIEQ